MYTSMYTPFTCIMVCVWWAGDILHCLYIHNLVMLEIPTHIFINVLSLSIRKQFPKVLIVIYASTGDTTKGPPPLQPMKTFTSQLTLIFS